jgi:glutamate synthase domain-containing protein 2
MTRRWFYGIALVAVLLSLGASLYWPGGKWLLLFVGSVALLGLHDALQGRHTILRNFPIIGHIRYCFESLRPEIQQYFIDSNIDANPIEREFRSVVYQRAKGQLETKPFGTERDVYRVGYEWASHSIAARTPPDVVPKVTVGTADCSKPYDISIFNISAMSYGSLSGNAVRALNAAAKKGGFAHNTGEGGISPYHREPGGDLIWQIGTGYFGCRQRDGGFDAALFREEAQRDQVKMIEVKLSQGAKPGHGGILPAQKVSREIAEIRHVPLGETVFSPPSHSAFSNPIEFVEFLARLRELSGGKPVGFKLCIGRQTDFFAICKAMIDTGIKPDFITVDGGEGGTAAAPLEFSNSVGMPARDGWIFVQSALCGAGLRDDIRIIASGKILTGFHIIRAMAIGADLCYSARGMMLALGCIQSLRCNSNRCPTGITTQNPALTYGLKVPEKTERVWRYHTATVKGALELLGAIGLDSLDDLRPHHIFRRVDDLRVRNLQELYDYMKPGALLEDTPPEACKEEWTAARSDSWLLKPESGQHGL